MDGAPPAGCTLAVYAAAKGLPVAYLEGLGVTEVNYPDGRGGTVRALRTPYHGLEDEELAVQFRLELDKRCDSADQRFRWQAGHQPQLYGLSRLGTAQFLGYVVMPEGPSDAQTLWLHNEPALALPSANAWREEWAHYLDSDIERIIVVLEPDSGGEAVLRWLARSSIRSRAWLVRMTPEAKDVSAFYLQDPKTFPERWQALVATAIPWSDEVDAEHDHDASEQESLHEQLSSWAEETSRLSALERELARDAKIAELKGTLKAPARVVDAALGSLRSDEAGDAAARGSTVVLSEPEPWPDEVDGAALLDELASTYARHLALPEGAAAALALWVVHTYCFDAFSVTPRLAVCSPDKRCGKTRLLTLCLYLCQRPLPASNVTTAVVFRAIERYRPTLLIDEADTFLADKEELRGILNSGHTKDMAVVLRTVGDDFEPTIFSTWGPVAIAQIGRLPATLEDRSLVVQMRRRAPHEVIEALTDECLHALAPLRSQAARWAADCFDALRGSKPVLPDLGSDRSADNWRPLIAIAELAGGQWPERGRAAVRALQGKESSQDSAGVVLLGDLRDLFAREGADRLTSEAIVKSLIVMEERPWPEWRAGKPISARQVARLLSPFGISPETVRFPGEGTKRGYLREHFDDAFERYLPERSATSATCLQTGSFPSATSLTRVAHENDPVCSDVALVADELPEEGLDL